MGSDSSREGAGNEYDDSGFAGGVRPHFPFPSGLFLILSGEDGGRLGFCSFEFEMKEFGFDTLSYSSRPSFIELGSLRFYGILYDIAAYCFRAKHVQFKALDIRHLRSHFVLDGHANHVERMQRKKERGKIPRTRAAQRGDKARLTWRRKHVAGTGGMNVSLEQRFARDFAFCFFNETEVVFDNNISHVNEWPAG